MRVPLPGALDLCVILLLMMNKTFLHLWFPCVDNSLIQSGAQTAGVYHATVSGKRYHLTFYEAQRMCEILGGNLASYDQLFRAWQEGMETCR